MARIIRGHPLFFDDPTPNAKAEVRWYRCRSLDCLGKAFYDASSNRDCRASLSAKVRHVEEVGHPTRYAGHQLRKPYKDVFEFVLTKYRFFAFRCAHRFFITNGNVVTKPNQEPDYIIAQRCADEFFADPDTLSLRCEQ